MFDQILINGIGSYDQFGASVSERTISPPKKKSIKETVPYSNETYDFSGINGELYWEERTLTYVFEILENSPEEMEEKKAKFMAWIMNAVDVELHDIYITGRHFLATYDDSDVDDSEVEKTTITVIFKAYPYMISDSLRSEPFFINAAAKTVTVINKSSHRVMPTFSANVPFSVAIGSNSFTLPAGESESERIMLSPGENTLTLTATGTSGSVSIRFREEVF